MRLWQKIFLPSAALTMAGIFVIAMSLVVRSHTLQLMAQKEAVMSDSSKIITELERTLEERKRGYFLSSAIMEELLVSSCREMTDETMEVSVRLLRENPYEGKDDNFICLKENGIIYLQTTAFLSGELWQINIEKNMQPLLEQFQEEVRTVQAYGVVVSMAISVFLLILSVGITRPVKKMEEATKRISAGDYSYRIAYKGSDELSELSQHMNEMAAHIEADTDYIEKISENRRKFIADMTHELKTPLTSILGFADVLRIKPDISDEERRDYADIIFTEAERLKLLSSRLMELITISETKLQMVPVDIAGLLAREAEMYRPVSGKAGVLLTLDLEPAVILAEETLLATLFVNLIDNARKASAPGKTIHISSRREDARALIQVADQGIGIPKEQIAYVTEAFYMVDKARTRKAGGAGIGLALCKAIAAAHHGELTVESKVNAGTTVTVSIPLYESGSEDQG